MNAPKLRFKEFNDEWSTENLSKVVTFSKGNSLSKSDLDESGPYPCILYGELYTKYHEVIRKVFSKTNHNSGNVVKSKYGDILIPASGETPIDISTASCLLLDNVLLGGDINILSPKNCDGRFISYVISNNKRKSIARVAQGHSIVHLYSENLKKIKLDIPSLKEQKKIADMLELLDKKIELQIKKIEALKLFKLSIKKKIFQTNINTEIKLNQLVKCESSSLTLSDIQNIDGPFPVYGAEGFIKNINFYNHNNEYIAIVKDGAGVGRTMICPSKSSTISTMNALIPILEYKATYIVELLNLINFKKYIIGSGIPHIYFKDYGKEKIKIHSIDKSNKITKLFDLLNKRINYTQNHVEHLKKLKQGLLQIMFI